LRTQRAAAQREPLAQASPASAAECEIATDICS
jgi:hypothetical protein